MGELNDVIKKHLAGKEKIVLAEYADVLRKCTEDLERLDKETSYFPIAEITESGIPGRWGEEVFSRGYYLTPRKWENESVETIKAKLEDTKILAKKYSDKTIELQDIIAKQK